MPPKIRDVEDVTPELGSYIGVESGSLLQRRGEVEQQFRQRIAADVSLDVCPSPSDVATCLWDSMATALRQPMSGETTARASNASRLLEDVVSKKAQRDSRLRKRASREKKQRTTQEQGVETGNEAVAGLQRQVAALQLQFDAQRLLTMRAPPATAPPAPPAHVGSASHDTVPMDTDSGGNNGGIDLMQQLVEAGITDEMARAATDELRSGLLGAGEEGSVERQHDKAREVIDAFRQTPFGAQSYHWIHRRGYVIIPTFSSQECLGKKPQFMTEKIHEEYLRETPGGRLEVPQKLKLATINSQKPWMVDLEKTAHSKKLGEQFMEGASSAAQRMAFSLQALSYGWHEKVDVEKLTLLLSAAAEGSQVLHKDQDGLEVQNKLRGQGSGTRGRSEPPPYSGVCAFRDPVYLHVIEGSHKDLLKDDYDWSDAREVIVPPGYGLLFHGCLVHAGGSYETVNGRLHLYFKCATGARTADGKFKQVKQTGVPPAAKEARP